MRCFSVIGPMQSGKSTLVQALAALEGGAVATGFHDGLGVTTFGFLGDSWTALDVAGGKDNLAIAGQALAASDAVVLCVPPEPEHAPLAAPYLRLVEASGVPCFLFVNRMDMAEARARDTVAGLQAFADHSIVLRQIPIRSDGHVTGAVDLISERAWQYQEGKPSALIEIPAELRQTEAEARSDLLDHLADFDDALLEELVEDRKPATDELFAVIARLHKHNDLIPTYFGSALHRNGVNRLMKSLRHETAGPEAVAPRLGLPDDVLAIAVAAEQKRHVGKTVLLRMLGPAVPQGASLGGATVGSLAPLGRNGVSGEAGLFAIAARADHLDRGIALADGRRIPLPDWTRGCPPAFRRVVSPANDKDDARLSAALARLAPVDPALSVGQAEQTGEMLVTVQGPMHLRRLLERLSADFGVAAEARPVRGSYRETIRDAVDHQHRHRKQSGGAGQFADVSMNVRPLARGEGFRFEETVKGGAVPRNYIPAVATGAEEAMAAGPMGFPVIDVGVTLVDGKHHAVDSSDHAFRTAGAACVREALRQGRPVLLQPVAQVRIHVPSPYTGSLVPLVSSLKGQVLGFEPHPSAKGWDVFRALIPVPAEDELLRAMDGLTHGTAWFESAFDHYEELPDKEAERIRKERSEAAA